nr:hypothetical protein [Nitrosomonas nitrosa]
MLNSSCFAVKLAHHWTFSQGIPRTWGRPVERDGLALVLLDAVQTSGGDSIFAVMSWLYVEGVSCSFRR